MTFTIYS